jgi:hypothetical protein
MAQVPRKSETNLSIQFSGILHAGKAGLFKATEEQIGWRRDDGGQFVVHQASSVKKAEWFEGKLRLLITDESQGDGASQDQIVGFDNLPLDSFDSVWRYFEQNCNVYVKRLKPTVSIKEADFDTALAAIEASADRVDEAQGDVQKKAREADLIQKVEIIRDGLDKAIGGDKQSLSRVFAANGCERIGHLRLVVDTVQVEVYKQDPRWIHLLHVCASIEAVLRELGTFRSWRPRKDQAGLSKRQMMWELRQQQGAVSPPKPYPDTGGTPAAKRIDAGVPSPPSAKHALSGPMTPPSGTGQTPMLPVDELRQRLANTSGYTEPSRETLGSFGAKDRTQSGMGPLGQGGRSFDQSAKGFTDPSRGTNSFGEKVRQPDLGPLGQGPLGQGSRSFDRSGSRGQDESDPNDQAKNFGAALAGFLKGNNDVADEESLNPVSWVGGREQEIDDPNSMLADPNGDGAIPRPTLPSGNIMEGWVWKKSRFLKRWRRRWLVLTEDSLASYKEPRDPEPTEKWAKGEVVRVHSSDNEVRWHLGFCVVANQRKMRNFYMVCDNDSIRTGWIQKASEVLAPDSLPPRMNEPASAEGVAAPSAQDNEVYD